jgi:hypothetical protein
MAKTTGELIKVIDEMIAITTWDNSDWMIWLTKCKTELESSDYHGIERLLGGYGGMGSFNDLVVGQSHDEKGTFKWRQGYKKKNSRLSHLRSKAYEIAQYIKHNHEIGP